jgi:hypothetical protein
VARALSFSPSPIKNNIAKEEEGKKFRFQNVRVCILKVFVEIFSYHSMIKESL